MICINLQSTNPYFNLAAEEFLLKNFADDILLIWQNMPAVIVGKHQNMMAEVNYPYVMGKGIPVIRRLSGGGTVFHDMGNVNFSYIANGNEGHVVDFKRFTRPVVDFLNEHGVPAILSGRNDILVDGFKFSGNAEHVYKQRVLHHGTLLFSSNLEMLREGIKPTGGTYSDKSVKSFRSRVANLSPYFKDSVDVSTFRSMLFSYLLERHSSSSYLLNDAEVEQIKQLEYKKYRSWDWNFGYSPDYLFVSNEKAIPNIQLSVKKGIIHEARIEVPQSVLPALTIEKLIGVSHDDFKTIKGIIDETCNGLLLGNLNAEECIY